MYFVLYDGEWEADYETEKESVNHVLEDYERFLRDKMEDPHEYEYNPDFYWEGYSIGKIELKGKELKNLCLSVLEKK